MLAHFKIFKNAGMPHFIAFHFAALCRYCTFTDKYFRKLTNKYEEKNPTDEDLFLPQCIEWVTLGQSVVIFETVINF